MNGLSGFSNGVSCVQHPCPVLRPVRSDALIGTGWCASPAISGVAALGTQLPHHAVFMLTPKEPARTDPLEIGMAGRGKQPKIITPPKAGTHTSKPASSTPGSRRVDWPAACVQRVAPAEPHSPRGGKGRMRILWCSTTLKCPCHCSNVEKASKTRSRT